MGGNFSTNSPGIDFHVSSIWSSSVYSFAVVRTCNALSHGMKGCVVLTLILYFSELEGATPFTRKIQPDELWLYKNPRSDSYVPTNVLWVSVVCSD